MHILCLTFKIAMFGAMLFILVGGCVMYLGRRFREVICPECGNLQWLQEGQENHVCENCNYELD